MPRRDWAINISTPNILPLTISWSEDLAKFRRVLYSARSELAKEFKKA